MAEKLAERKFRMERKTLHYSRAILLIRSTDNANCVPQHLSDDLVVVVRTRSYVLCSTLLYRPESSVSTGTLTATVFTFETQHVVKFSRFCRFNFTIRYVFDFLPSKRLSLCTLVRRGWHVRGYMNITTFNQKKEES